MKNAPFIISFYAILLANDSSGQADTLVADKSGFYNAVRVGVGLEKSPYLELGYSRIGIADKTWPGSICFYGAGQLRLSS